MLNQQGATPRLTYEKAVKEFVMVKGEFETSTARAKGSEARVVALTKEIEAAKKTLDEKNAELEEGVSICRRRRCMRRWMGWCWSGRGRRGRR